MLQPFRPQRKHQGFETTDRGFGGLSVLRSVFKVNWPSFPNAKDRERRKPSSYRHHKISFSPNQLSNFQVIPLSPPSTSSFKSCQLKDNCELHNHSHFLPNWVSAWISFVMIENKSKVFFICQTWNALVCCLRLFAQICNMQKAMFAQICNMQYKNMR